MPSPDRPGPVCDASRDGLPCNPGRCPVSVEIDEATQALRIHWISHNTLMKSGDQQPTACHAIQTVLLSIIAAASCPRSSSARPCTSPGCTEGYPNRTEGTLPEAGFPRLKKTRPMRFQSASLQPNLLCPVREPRPWKKVAPRDQTTG